MSLSVTFMARSLWINQKIAALSSPTPTPYTSANAMLPPKGTRTRIVLIGDSRISRWPASGWPDNWEIINRGAAGETAAQLAFRFQSDAIALNPDVIVVEAGINDLIAATFLDKEEQESVVDKTAAIFQRLVSDASATRHPIFVATVIPPARPDFLRLLVWKRSLRELVAKTNQLLLLSKMPNRAAVIDLSIVLQAKDQVVVSDAYRLDTLHLNEAGYGQLTTTIIKNVQSMMSTTQP